MINLKPIKIKDEQKIESVINENADLLEVVIDKLNEVSRELEEIKRQGYQGRILEGYRQKIRTR